MPAKLNSTVMSVSYDFFYWRKKYESRNVELFRIFGEVSGSRVKMFGSGLSDGLAKTVTPLTMLTHTLTSIPFQKGINLKFLS